MNRTVSVIRPLLLSLGALLLCSCSTVAPLTAPRPGDGIFRTELKREISTLNIPVETTADDLARVFNQAARTDLYKGPTAIRGVSAVVVRSAPIAVRAADNYLYVTLPVSLSLSYAMFETKAIPFTLKFRAAARITPDWQLHTDISYLGLSDLLAENVSIGPLSFKPRSFVEGITQPLQKMLSEQITRKINEQLPLKTQALNAWNRAQQPVLLDRSVNAWLQLTPGEIIFYPLDAQNNQVRASVGIRTYAELILGAQPADRQPLPLPPLKQAASFDKTFRIALNADLPYRDLRDIAAPLLLDKTFTTDGRSVVIREFDLYGNGDKIVIKVRTEGALDGLFYLTGRPAFSAGTNVFSVEDVDFDMQTRDLLLQSADWFLHGSIREMIREKLNLNLGKKLEQSRQLAGKALSRMQLTDHMSLKGNIKTLAFSDMIVRKDMISIQIYAEGEASIFFH